MLELMDAQTRFVELMGELFQLDEAEALDFGIYRIIRHRNQAVRDFLGRIERKGEQKQLVGGRLQAALEEAFASADAEGLAQIEAHLRELEADLGIARHATGAQREEALVEAYKRPKLRADVDEYRNLLGQQATAQHGSGDRLEVLNRLHQFFERHYQDGDFIVQRRYGQNSARYIRSTGEDTEFRWATEDMYYIKSGDVFTDWPVRLANGAEVIFAVDPESLRATRAALKPTDKAHYELCRAEKEGDALRLTLNYHKGARKNSHDEAIVKAVRTKVGADEADIKRWLARYIARNQSDFFIHKRLGEALNEELDIFLKTDVLDAGQLLIGGEQSLRHARVAQLVRRIGREIIAFLATLEDFQKSLWEKKKLVLETRYVVSLDRIEKLAGRGWLETHLPEIVKRQRKEWQELGLGDYDKPAECLRPAKGGLFDEGAMKYLPLPVDTKHFDTAFRWEMLAALTSSAKLDEAVDGSALRSDNWQALNTLSTKYGEAVKCIYIDPPYNTNSSSIPYKNSYRESSFAAMMHNRVDRLHRLLPADGAIFVSIDKTERTLLEHTMDSVFGRDNRVEELIWAMNTNNSQAPNYSTNHEYVEVYARNRAIIEQDKSMFREPKPGYEEVMELVAALNPRHPPVKDVEAAIRTLYERHKLSYRDDIESQGLEWEDEKDGDPWRGLFNYCHAEYRDAEGRLIDEREAEVRQANIWVWQEDNTSMPATKQADSTRDPGHRNWRFYTPAHPVTGNPVPHPKSGWKFAFADDEDSPDRRSFQSLDRDHRIAWGTDENKVPRLKRMLHEVETNIGKSVFRDYSDGEKQTSAMFGKSGVFLAPKHSDFVARFVLQGSKPDSVVLDCFGGSGSTAHAVMNINRLERSARKFITVEVNRYFDTLIVPRLKKAASALTWSKGKAIATDGPGVFLRVQHLEQYEDTLENLALEAEANTNTDLDFDDNATLLGWRLDGEARKVYGSIEHFRSPFGYRLRRAQGAGPAEPVEVDLVESLVWLLGLDVATMRRETEGVRVTGQNRRGESVLVCFRECDVAGSGDWVMRLMAAQPDAVHVYCNDPADLAFPGAERLQSIEAVFARQFGNA